MTPPQRRAFHGPSETTFALLGAYLLLSSLFLWQAWRRETPTIFTDELEMTQLSRSIAETAEPARRGVPLGFTTLVPWFTAPFWWISDTNNAYAAIRMFQALVMAATILPAYKIARFAVSRPWAVFAAIAAIATPALSYSPILVEEPFAYPASALALWLILRAIRTPTRWPIALAVAAALFGMLIRSQLIALPAILALGLLTVVWRSEAMRGWRSTWTRNDWMGAVLLAIGAFFAVTAFVGSQSADWAEATSDRPEKIFEYGTWAGGGFAIGVGFLPAIALLAIVFAPAAERARPRMRAFVVVSAASIATIGWYAAIKAAYVSAYLGGDVVERNLIYLVPLATAALAATLQRAAAPLWAILASGAVVLGLVLAVPLSKGTDLFPYYEAHGLAILAFFNREFAWPQDRIQTALVVAVVVATALLAVRTAFAERRQLVAAVSSIAIVATLALGLTAEIYAEVGEHRLSRQVAQNLVKPYDWIDRRVGDDKATVFAQTVTDATGIQSTEFWNRAITQVWSVEGSAPGPGPEQTPDLARPDGTLRPEPGTPYVVEFNGVEVVGETIESRGPRGGVLVRIGNPFRLRFNAVGIEADGWMTSKDSTTPARAAYNRFDVSADTGGLVIVTLSRETFCPKPARILPGTTTVRIGTLGVGSDKQPAIDRVLGTETRYVPACGSRVVAFAVPDQPWRIEIEGETFVPAEIDQRSSDARHLGARVNVSFGPG